MTIDTNIQIAPVTLAEVLRLRDRILRANLSAGGSELRSDRNADTLHLGALAGNELIGVSTIAREDPASVQSGDVWRLCGMAVNANWRGHGVGTALAEKCVDHAKLAVGHMVWCSARESAFDFYRSIGFELVGELYNRVDITGERYARMVRYLSNYSDD
ncbi:GNAT family N-acetyltransferase [Paraburkholderia aspalathi]|uniref:GNAT family N-acetyltransferase n=1 Tax=Paraburkholderia aspalathi TaxID=1324617 RepID=UPI0038BD40F2